MAVVEHYSLQAHELSAGALRARRDRYDARGAQIAGRCHDNARKYLAPGVLLSQRA